MPPAPACVPLTAGTHRLAPIGGRVPVVLHFGGTAKPGAPLVLGLPGAGQTARDFAAYTGFSKLADRKGFSVAYPTATGSRPYWNISGALPGKPDDVAYLREVIPAAVRAACADPARVGVTGVSNGGGMTARLACDAADLIAAAAPVAGGYRSLPDCRPPRPVPILEIHGAVDQVVPYRGTGSSGAGRGVARRGAGRLGQTGEGPGVGGDGRAEHRGAGPGVVGAVGSHGPAADDARWARGERRAGERREPGRPGDGRRRVPGSGAR